MIYLFMRRVPSQSYGASPATWDHTVLPATRHKWTCPTSKSWYSVYLPGGMEGWVDLGYLAMHHPGVELAVSRSQVWRPNYYTTEPPYDLLIIYSSVEGRRLSECVCACWWLISEREPFWSVVYQRILALCCARFASWPRHLNCWWSEDSWQASTVVCIKASVDLFYTLQNFVKKVHVFMK